MGIENFKHTDEEGIDRSIGEKAEAIFGELIENKHQNISARYSTEGEDSGLRQIVQGKQIDAVIYVENKPAMVAQITTARSSGVREDKKSQLIERPFVRLDEMDLKDTPIPKVLVYIDPEEIKSFINDGDISQHPKIEESIRRGIVNSLKLDLMKTQNPLEQKKVKELLEIYEK